MSVANGSGDVLLGPDKLSFFDNSVDILSGNFGPTDFLCAKIQSYGVAISLTAK